MEKDYYKILEVDKNASKEEIKKKYKELVKKYHPYSNTETSSEEKFKEINEAYAVLSDDKKRAEYDNPIKMHTMERTTVKVGEPLEVTVSLSIYEAFCGIEKTIHFKRKVNCVHCNGTGAKDKTEHVCKHCNGTGVLRQMYKQSNNFYFQSTTTCPYCNGTGREKLKEADSCKYCNGTGLEEVDCTEEISIPAGVFSGIKINAGNIGNEPVGGGIMGELIINIIVEDDDYFKQDNFDIIHYEYVKFNDALLGCEKEIRFIDGTKTKLVLPEKTLDGYQVEFKGKGMPKIRQLMSPFSFDNSKNGNYIVIVKHIYPEFTKEQKKILKELW